MESGTFKGRGEMQSKANRAGQAVGWRTEIFDRSDREHVDVVFGGRA